MLGVAVAGAVLLSLASPAGATDQGAPAAWVDWLKLVLGALLLLVAVRQTRARPAADAVPAAPKWMGALEGVTPVKAGGLAVLLGTVNPKNLLFIAGGAAAVAQTGVSAGDQVVAWVVFTVIAT